jgi:hypothetical protein
VIGWKECGFEIRKKMERKNLSVRKSNAFFSYIKTKQALGISKRLFFFDNFIRTKPTRLRFELSRTVYLK